MLTPPPSAPRPAPFRAMDWNASFLLLFGGIWTAVGIILCTLFTVIGGPVWNDWILDSRGLRAEATPLTVSATNTRINRRQLYDIRYRFSDAAGTAWTAETGSTNGALIQAAQSGKGFAIDYDPQSPQRTRVSGESASMMGMGVVIPLAGAIVGLVLLLMGLLSAMKSRRIYASGEAVQAQVIDLEKTSSRQNRRTVMQMVYLFQTPRGPIEGRWKTAHPAPKGATIWVIYDPDDPTRNLPAV